MVSKQLFEQHVASLHSLQQDFVYTQPARASRLTYLLRRLAMKLRKRLPRTVKYSYCKHCYTPFAPGKNCRVRTREGRLVYSCFSCNKHTRLVLS